MAVMTTVEVISHGMALLPNQRQIQGKDVYGNPKTVLYVTNNPMLQVVNFPVLQGFRSSDSPLEITNNSLLTSLGFPKLEMAGVVIVANNTALTSLVFVELYSMTNATISNNPALQVVHFPSLPSSNACSVVGFEGNVVFSDRNVTYPVDGCP